MDKEQSKAIGNFYCFITAVFEYAVRCWQRGEGKFEVSITDDKGKVQGKITGGHSWRSSKLEDEEI